MPRPPRRPCLYCGQPVVVVRIYGVTTVRAWCRLCLERIRTTGIVDQPDYVTMRDVRKRRRLWSLG
jgi:hypothetical protein